MVALVLALVITIIDSHGAKVAHYYQPPCEWETVLSCTVRSRSIVSILMSMLAIDVYAHYRNNTSIY
jgi:hypothetical protein